MTAEAAPSVPASTRREIWSRLGAPTDQIGSVNDPRIHEEAGVRWNEKWIYRRPGSLAIVRVVFWHRYDFRGVFRMTADGTLEPEPLPEP